MQASSNTNNLSSFLGNFLLSGISSILAKSSGAPFERVKLLLQCENLLLKQGKISAPYGGVVDCASRTYQNEGALSFWRGNLVNCLRYFPTQVISFMLKDRVKSFFKANKNDSFLVSYAKNILYGTVTGIIGLGVVYSLDFAYTSLTTDLIVNGGRQYKNIFDVYAKTIASNGFFGLYHGFGITCFGVFLYRLSYFVLYDFLRPIVLKKQASFLLQFSFAYFITITSGLITFPIDTIRRQMILTSQGATVCFTEMVRNGGYMALMNGASANILKGFVCAIAVHFLDGFIKAYFEVEVKGNAS